MAETTKLPDLEPLLVCHHSSDSTMHIRVMETLRTGGAKSLSDAWRIMLYLACRPDMKGRVYQWADHYNLRLGFFIVTDKRSDGGDVSV